jgi:hypothetical protein
MNTDKLIRGSTATEAPAEGILLTALARPSACVIRFGRADCLQVVTARALTYLRTG